MNEKVNIQPQWFLTVLLFVGPIAIAVLFFSIGYSRGIKQGIKDHRCGELEVDDIAARLKLRFKSYSILTTNSNGLVYESFYRSWDNITVTTNTDGEVSTNYSMNQK